ncbi:MAG: AsnC family transcriptional regulator [Thermoprotei archaeon]|nr:MAG: AsnC family transcriptional regulator [Thermofilum sp. ex4484_79]RLE61751.1 MAG: AsnC family transcriptional regulator [Thermoprotei archaeon]HDD63571.1 Lrp/AsnC family transcriptional regulator [Thermoprotei archaeon]
MERRSFRLTDKQLQLLKLLLKKSKSMQIFTVTETQNELAKELGITRQALNVHLRKLRENGLIRTGRGFIDLTEKALEALGVKSADVFVLVRVEPRMRNHAYARIKALPVEKIYRVTGEIDLIIVVNQAHLDEFLRKISRIEGVEETVTHVVIESIK